MTIGNTFRNILLVVAACGFLASCEKEYDTPPIKSIPEGEKMEIKDLYQIYRDSVQGHPTRSNYRFQGEHSVYATVTMDETSGNVYKTVYVQDDNDALALGLRFSGGLYQGDYVRIYLKGTTLTYEDGFLMIDSVDVDEHIIKQSTDNEVIPKKLTLDQLYVPDTADDGTIEMVIDSAYFLHLVEVDSVEFKGNVAGETVANEGEGWFKEYDLINCSNTYSLMVHSSDYSNFASELLPMGNGTIVGILGNYRGSAQFIIRDPDEMKMDNPRCTKIELLSKDFDDGSISSGGWVNYWTGTTNNGTDWGKWKIFGDDVAACTNFDFNTFTNYATTSWLISPAVDLTEASNAVLNFDNTYRYNGPQLELWISTDYDGSSNPADQGNWENISNLATWNSNGSTWDFTNSGDIDLSSYQSSSTYIAFKYIGTNSEGATWELDNIKIIAD